MRQRFLRGLTECSDEIQGVVFQMVSIVENPRTTASERHRALATIAKVLSLNSATRGASARTGGVRGQRSSGALQPGGRCRRWIAKRPAFADRLHELMELKRVTQQELSNRVGCSQPAISQMLNRKCRPQKKTILKLAEVLAGPTAGTLAGHRGCGDARCACQLRARGPCYYGSRSQCARRSCHAEIYLRSPVDHCLLVSAEGEMDDGPSASALRRRIQ